MKNRLLLLIGLLILALSVAEASDKTADKLPKLLANKNYASNEFWLTFPPAYGGNSYEKILIYVTADKETDVTVRIPGKDYEVTKKTIPSNVIEFELTPTQAFPYIKLANDPEVAEKVYDDNGIHVYSEDQIIVYCLVLFESSSDGFMALPVRDLGTNYVVSSYDDMSGYVGGSVNLPSLCGIVATENGTTVSFTVGGNNTTETAGGVKTGQTMNATINIGDVWMISSMDDGSDLTGSLIQSDKPVAVVSANQCANVDVANRWCDYIVAMDRPVDSWGTTYLVPKIVNRKFSPIIRVFAKEPYTDIYRDGSIVGSVKKFGGKISEGFIELRLVGKETETRSAVIHAETPIAVTLYNPGTEEDNDPDLRSDPFMLPLSPYKDFRTEVSLSSPGKGSKNNYIYNYIALIYETAENGGMPDDIMLGRYQGTDLIWYKMNSFYPGIDEKFTYQVNGKNYAHKIIELVDDGPMKIRADNPFMTYVYGFTQGESYGYASDYTFGNPYEEDQSKPEITAITVNCDGTIDFTVTDMPETGGVQSGLVAPILESGNSYNFEFTYNEFAPGSPSADFHLEVLDVTEDAHAEITFSDRAGNDTVFVFEYYGRKVAFDQTSYDFGTAPLEEQFTAVLPLTNNSEMATFEVKELKLKDGTTGFEVNIPIDIPWIMAPGESLNVDLSFANIEPGTYIDTIIVCDTCLCLELAEVKITVNEPGEPVIAVSDIDFGQADVSEPSTMHFTVQNTGEINLLLTDYSGPESEVFDFIVDEEFSNSSPLVLGPGESKNFNVTFAPTETVEYIDSIVFISSSLGGDNVCLLNGSGISGVPDVIANRYIELSPNPVSDVLNINFELTDPAALSVKVFDMKGNLMHNVTEGVLLSSGSQSFAADVSNFAQAAYVVQFSYGGSTHVMNFRVIR